MQLLLWVKRTGYRPLKPPTGDAATAIAVDGALTSMSAQRGERLCHRLHWLGVSTAPNPTASDAKGRASVMAYSSDDPGPERVYVWTEHTPIWAVFDLTAIAPAP